MRPQSVASRASLPPTQIPILNAWISVHAKVCRHVWIYRGIGDFSMSEICSYQRDTNEFESMNLIVSPDRALVCGGISSFGVV